MKVVRPKEIEAVLKLPPEKRLDYFVKWVADGRKVWGLRRGDQWILVTDQGGAKSVPLWPLREYAVLCAAGSYADTEVASMTLHFFTKTFAPDLTAEKIGVTVLPTPAMVGDVVSPVELTQRLRDELKRWY